MVSISASKTAGKKKSSASLKAKPDEEAYKSPLQFGKDAKLWARQFRKVTFDEDVTPYIHGTPSAPEIQNAFTHITVDKQLR